MRTVTTLLCSFALLAASGCGDAHFETRHFVGKWRAVEPPPLSVAERPGATELLLRSDGTFVAEHVSADFLSFSRELPSPLPSLTGTWLIDDRFGYDRLVLTILTADRGVPLPLPYGVELMAAGSPAAPALFYYVGDPDENRRVSFARSL